MRAIKYLHSISLAVCILLFGQTKSLHAYSFLSETLQGISITHPTSLDLGPDGRLYVAQQDGMLHAFTVERAPDGSYHAISQETILLIQQIQNHDDSGKVNNSQTTRQVTGLLAVGTATNPVLYVSSSDPRIGGGGSGGDSDLDTNSGIVSRLTWNGSSWDKVDIVCGLPRSEENHSVNGMQYDAVNNHLYLAVGGMTNAGSPSNNFAYISDYALAAAILQIDLNAIEAMPVLGTAPSQYIYDLPTLDDPTRAGTTDANDPFGGNDGLNQAMLDPAGPITIFSPGYRNAFDIVLTQARRLYTWDNGPNQGWGGYPENEGTTLVDGELTTSVTNNYVPGEPGSNGPGTNDDIVNNQDGLHLIASIDSYTPGSYYGGHPNPTRANPAGAGLYTYASGSGTFRTGITGNPATTLPSNWPPIPVDMADPIQGDYQNPGVDDNSLYTLESSTNGMTEYTASNFDGELQGDLLAVSFDGAVYRVDIDNSTGSITGPSDVSVLATGFGSTPIDITAQSDTDDFPGTIWVANYVSNSITIFEPADFFDCDGTYDSNLDEDMDGYNNADEIDTLTDPCNAASTPPDVDGDFISDYNDPDDDNDGIPDTADLFPVDAQNGLTTTLPVEYELLNGDPGFGFYGLGFTGLMHDGVSDYSTLIADEVNSSVEIIAGGAVGLLTMNDVDSGDALGALNTQKNGFQFGINVMPTTPPFTVRALALGPVFTNPPDGHASMGIYVGTGTQDDYIKVVIDANEGTPGMSVVSESAGAVTSQYYAAPGVDSASEVYLFLSVDPASGTVQPRYAIGSGTTVDLGSPIAASGALLNCLQAEPALAVGVIATSREATHPFNATWEEIFITYDSEDCDGFWHVITDSSGTFTARHETTYVQVGGKFYLVGGRGSRPLDIYDPATNTWTSGATPPLQFHHFQAVELDGELWVAGAFIGTYPNETPVSTIYIYNPGTDSWRTGPTIQRPRGSAGAVVHEGKLYLAGGLTNGHVGGFVPWFDCYDPATGIWTQLADAPRARDHFHMQVVDGKLWLAAGRQTEKDSAEGVFGNTVAEVDDYDFTTGTWNTLPPTSNIPTQRAGTAAAVLGDELIIIGGESLAQTEAHSEVEALNAIDQTWRSLPPMIQGRHATGLLEYNGRLYTASGSATRGDGTELVEQEVLLPCSEFTPTITPDASSLYFETDPGVASSPQVITLTNNSPYDLNIASTTTNDPAFVLQATPASTLAPGGQTLVSVTFEPEADTITDISGTLRIVSNATNTPVLTIPLDGHVLLNVPEPGISSPADASEYLAGQSIHLVGASNDDYGNDISASGVWTSDLDGTLGTGPTLTVSHLSIGTHTITFTVTDSFGVSGQTSITLVVKENIVIAINSGDQAYAAADGTNYIADDYFTGGEVYPLEGDYIPEPIGEIENTNDDALYQIERVGAFSYNIPVSPGDYFLTLQFAEIYFNRSNIRQFDVDVEGVQTMTAFDIFAQAGGKFKAIDQTFSVTVSDSSLDIDFVPNVENPKLSALRLVQAYPTPDPVVIESPAHGSRYPAARNIHFNATGPGTAEWSSSLDGVIGNSTTFDTDTLSEGTHTITLTMTDSEVRTATLDLDILEPYTYWSDDIPWGGADSTKTGDPDFDSIVNDLERALNLNPLVSDADRLPFVGTLTEDDIPYFTFTYRRNLNATDLNFWIDSTEDLSPASWLPELLDETTQDILSDDGSTQVIRFKKAMTGQAHDFFRLRVE